MCRGLSSAGEEVSGKSQTAALTHSKPYHRAYGRIRTYIIKNNTTVTILSGFTYWQGSTPPGHLRECPRNKRMQHAKINECTGMREANT